MASKTTVKDAAQTFEAIATDTQAAAKEQFEKLSSGFEKLTELSQENVDAMLKSQEIATKAAEGFGSEVADFSKKSFEQGVAAAQDMASAKNMTELFEMQTTFTKSFFEDAIKQSTKMNEMFAATAKDMMAPLNARMSAASDVMKTFSA